MSIKNTTTTSDYIEWNKAMNLVRKLYADGEYRLSLLIGCGCFFGLRISDLLSLNWDMLLSNDSFEITEKKTKKHREIAVNRYFQNHIQDCYNALKIGNDKEPCFISQKKCVYSPQRINAMFKVINRKYQLGINHFSTHSLRKTFGRRIVEMSPNNAEMALIKLSEIFNHANVSTTRRYLGLRQQELMEAYTLLDF